MSLGLFYARNIDLVITVRYALYLREPKESEYLYGTRNDIVMGMFPALLQESFGLSALQTQPPIPRPALDAGRILTSLRPL